MFPSETKPLKYITGLIHCVAKPGYILINPFGVAFVVEKVLSDSNFRDDIQPFKAREIQSIDIKIRSVPLATLLIFVV